MTEPTDKLATLKEVEDGMEALIAQARDLREKAPTDDIALRAEYLALADGFEKAAAELRDAIVQLRMSLPDNQFPIT